MSEREINEADVHELLGGLFLEWEWQRRKYGAESMEALIVDAAIKGLVRVLGLWHNQAMPWTAGPRTLAEHEAAGEFVLRSALAESA